MTAGLQLPDSQRRSRLLTRHLLAGHPPTSDPVAVTRAVIALHSTDPAAVQLAAAARGCSRATLEQALYEDRTLVRLLGMRRTMFVVTAGLAPVVHAAATRAIAVRERGRFVGFIEQDGLAADGDRFLRELEDATMAALAETGSASGAELGAAVPGLRRQIHIAGGTQSLTTRVLFVLAAEGRIVRGRPKGSWISSQYSWIPATEPPPSEQDLPTAEAQQQLAEAYLRAYGPATMADLQWWTGWTAGQTKRAVAGLDTVAVHLDHDAGGLVLAADTDIVEPPPQPTARLLPALDPTVMGWAQRDFYLDADHRQPAAVGSLFDRSGNPGPTVWWNGRIVGGWAQRKDGKIVWRILADLGRDVAQASREIESEAARTAELLGKIRVTPRFRTPLERDLVS